MKMNLAWGETERSAAKPGNIRIRRMRADRDAARCGCSYGIAHRHRIPGVEAASDVGGRHEVEQRFVLRKAGVSEAFTQICVEIDRGVQGLISFGFFSSRRKPAWLRRPPIPARRPRTRRV